MKDNNDNSSVVVEKEAEASEDILDNDTNDQGMELCSIPKNASHVIDI